MIYGGYDSSCRAAELVYSSDSAGGVVDGLMSASALMSLVAQTGISPNQDGVFPGRELSISP